MNKLKTNLFINMVHNRIGQTPFIFTVLTAIVVYGIMLSVYAANFGARWADWYFAIFSWVLFVVVVVISILYVQRLFGKNSPLVGWTGVIGFFDTYLAFAHALAAVGMSIYALDTSVTRDTYIAPVGSPTQFGPFAVYFADFLCAVLHVVNTAGYVAAKPVPGQAIGALWGITTTVSGLLVVGFVFVIVVDRRMLKAKEQQQRVKEEKLPILVKAGFTADYGGLYCHGKGAARRMRAPGPNHVLRDDLDDPFK